MCNSSVAIVSWKVMELLLLIPVLINKGKGKGWGVVVHYHVLVMTYIVLHGWGL